MAGTESETKRVRRLTEEERRLFAAATRDVVPMQGREPPPGRGVGPSAPPRAAATPAPARDVPQTVPPPLPDLAPDLAPDLGPDLGPALAPGVAPGLDRRTLDRLRRGRIPPEATLDLHGHTQEAAYAALHGFIARCHGQGLRCLVVVTGKGNVGAGGGVLRRQVPLWLNRPPSRERVLGFVEAPPRHGGKGALLVLLRRKRA